MTAASQTRSPIKNGDKQNTPLKLGECMNMKKLAPTLLAILLLAGAVLAVHFFQKNSSGEKPAASGASQTASDQLVNTPAGEESQAKQPPGGQIVLEGEMRAVWVPYLSLDQSKIGQGQEAFQKAFDEIVSQAKEYGLNTLIVHVRPFGDAMYPSEIYPWSHLLTGTQGGDPGFDPLEYMVRKTHEAGMQFHAWLNPLRIQSKGTPSILAPDHLYTQWREDSDPNNDDWVVDWEEGKYFNPAYPEVREKIIEGIREIVENYPVDAIHFDDYFYPTSDGAFDEKAYQAYTESVGEGVPLTLPQWRIANINTLVSGVYSAIKSINPQVQFGISPQGNITNDLNMGADVETWASQKGYVDYLCPQIYVNFDHPLLPFNQTADQWRQMTTAEGVKLYIGLAVYKAGSEDADSGTWNGKTDILQREIEYSRSLGCDGIMLYSWDYMDTSQTQEEVANVIKIFQEGSGN